MRRDHDGRVYKSYVGYNEGSHYGLECQDHYPGSAGANSIGGSSSAIVPSCMSGALWE